MSADSKSDYLVISRGQWDKAVSKEEIQQAIDAFGFSSCGGSGAEKAKAAQREIIQTFLELRVSPKLKDASGKSVLD